MNFDLTPEQQQLADSVSKYLANEYSFEKRKAIVHSDSGVSETAGGVVMPKLLILSTYSQFRRLSTSLIDRYLSCSSQFIETPLYDKVDNPLVVDHSFRRNNARWPM